MKVNQVLGYDSAPLGYTGTGTARNIKNIDEADGVLLVLSLQPPPMSLSSIMLNSRALLQWPFTSELFGYKLSYYVPPTFYTLVVSYAQPSIRSLTLCFFVCVCFFLSQTHTHPHTHTHSLSLAHTPTLIFRKWLVLHRCMKQTTSPFTNRQMLINLCTSHLLQIPPLNQFTTTQCKCGGHVTPWKRHITNIFAKPL